VNVFCYWTRPAKGVAMDLAGQYLSSAGARLFRRALGILRAYDPRCATCRSPGAQFRCPGGMESYCSKECQRAHWQEHKKKHRSKMNKEIGKAEGETPFCKPAGRLGQVKHCISVAAC